MASEILNEFDSHKPLIEAKVRIDYLFAYGERDDDGKLVSDAIVHHGVRALGQARILPVKDRVMGRGDAEIMLDGDYWTEKATEEMQRAILDHELHHVSLKVKKGQYLYDEAGRPQLKMRKHEVQVGWFPLIAERHGKHSQERIQAEVILDTFGQYLFPQLAEPKPQSKIKDKP